jgi:hypothetical protein
MPAPTKTVNDFIVFNSTTAQIPWVSARPNGGFDIAFSNLFSNAGTDDDTRFAHFNAFGVGAGGTIISNQGSGVDEIMPSMASLANGLIAMTWVEKPDAGGGNGRDVYYRVLDPVSQTNIVARTLVAGGVGDQVDPVIAASPDGGFAIAWNDQNIAGGAVSARIYNSAGGSLVSIPTVNATAGVYSAGINNGFREVSITALADGNYVVGWSDDNPFETRTRILNANGSLGAEVTLNPEGNFDFGI